MSAPLSQVMSVESTAATRVATPVSEEKIKRTDTTIKPQDALGEKLGAIVVESPAVDIAPDMAQASTTRKIVLMAGFATAQFLDAFNNSALFPAIPSMARELGFDASETVWIISAYQLTFAAFLLVSGRIADVYSPKPAFVAGSLILALTHLGGGFVRQKIAILILRALGGVGGALTIPSALSLIVQLFPDPQSQSRAIALFGGTGAIGNVLGLVIGAVFVQYTSWPWIFWFTAITGTSVAAITFVLIPGSGKTDSNARFDFVGIGTLSAAVILFIFAVTSGSVQGWGSAYVLAPLIIAVFLFAAFFLWESRIDEKDAAVPPSMWRFPNVIVLAALALLPYFWWVGIFIQLTSWWETFYDWSAINVAVHFLPLGVLAFFISNVAGYLPRYFDHKYIILSGLVLTLIGSAFLPFLSTPSTYWPYAFPSFVIGTTGTTIVFATGSIAIFASTPAAVAGTVGAIYNSALQLGSAVGLAAITSIQTSIDGNAVQEAQHGRPTTDEGLKEAYRGRSAAFWFIFAVVVIELFSILFFYRAKQGAATIEEEREEEQQQQQTGQAAQGTTFDSRTPTIQV